MSGALLALPALLILLAALLNAAQTAAFRVGMSHLRTLQEEGFRGAPALVQVRSEAGRVRVGIRLLTGALELIALALVVQSEVGGPGWLTASGRIALSVAVVLLVAEVLPLAVASRQPVRLALATAPILRRLAVWAGRVVSRLRWLEDTLRNGDEELSDEERELREIWELGKEAGVLEEAENLLVERAFRLDEMSAWDVMTPRVDIFAWKDDTRLEDIVEELSRVPYSRVPVYRDSVDDITGILYVREAYEHFTQGARGIPLSELARAPLFVPGSLSLAKLLQHFQSRRVHMGIVADEFGGTDGLVTLEDVIEELVGEIVDETDVAEDEIVRVSEREIEVDAGADVRDVNDAFGVEIPSDEHRSLNGFILEELGHVPAEGASFERAGVRIDIVEATETQVVRARLTRLAEPPSDDDAGS